MLYNVVLVSDIQQNKVSELYVYIYPFPLEPPSHLPPHPTPLDCHRASTLGSLHHTTNVPWLSVLHMVMCVFQSSLWITKIPGNPQVFRTKENKNTQHHSKASLRAETRGSEDRYIPVKMVA